VLSTPRDIDEPVHGVIDLVGGDQLAEAHGALAEGGTLVSVGQLAPGLSTVIGGPGRHDRSIVTFFLLSCTNLGPDLTWLAHRVAVGDLRPQISWRDGWDKASSAIEALLGRRLHGKAVLDVA
jgi:NADPH:quinone reductase-like Zn-dependent oxidoreductase